MSVRPLLPRARLVDGEISHRDAGRLIDWMRWWRPLKATMEHGRGDPHAWDIIPRWNPDKKRWEIKVLPGYVNGQEVEVTSPGLELEELPTTTLFRQKVGETGKPWLSEGPWFPVPVNLFRPLGVDAVGAESVPRYFLDRGVLPAETDSTRETPFGLVTLLGGTIEDRSLARKLVACEVMLEQPRPRLTAVEEQLPGGGVQLAVSIATPVGVDARPQVVLRKEAGNPQPLGSTLRDLLVGGATDSGLDRLRIGTLYLMSPPGEPRLVPNEEWVPVPRNRVFYDLNHAVNVEIDALAPFRLSFGDGGFLGAGLAQGVVENQLDALAAADGGVAAFLSTGRIEGQFWTV